jgi:hypothetical protein
MHLSGQQPSDEQLQLIQEKARYWRKVGNEARVQSINCLEDAAKQLVALIATLQELYFALFALSDLRKQLAALATSLLGAWFLLVFFLPIPIWLLSLYSATQVFVPQPRPGVNINYLDIDVWQDIQRLYDQGAEEKLRWLRRSHRWLLLSFVAEPGLLVLLAFLPATPDPGPTQIILLTPTPQPLPKS